MLRLREYQERAVNEAETRLRAGQSRLIVSPTGSGKGVCQAALMDRLAPEGLVQLAPSLEIVESIFTKWKGAVLNDLSEARRREATESVGLYTTKRYYNLVLNGSVPPPRWLSSDEAAHDVDTTHTVLRAACGNPPTIGWTATYYRGTPAETQKLRELWGEPFVALTLHDAAERGAVSIPTFETWPLVNDDLIDVQNGEFVTRQVEGATEDVLEDLCGRATSLFNAGDGVWHRTTMFSAPGIRSAGRICEVLNAIGLPAVAVTGDTSRADRDTAFRRTVDRTHALVQVAVVGEGVDLPIRVQVDLAPCFSPMKWMQRIGRTTRPVAEGEPPPRVIVANMNLIRHAYLFAGLIPPAAIRDAQQAWGPEYKPIRRTMARALGLEGFGRFKPELLPMKDGTAGAIYALQTPDGLHQYCVLLHPTRPDPLYFERQNALTGKMLEHKLPDGRVVEYAEKVWGKWKQIDAVPNADGYVSVKPGVLTPNMKDWWKRSAESRGFDPEAEINARQFVALACCCDTRTRL